jgi:hypothetical protein
VTFSEPITAGETILQNVNSEGYVAGVTGWRIERDGDAEFNDVTVRGDWQVQGPDPDDYIQARIVTGIPRLEFARDGVTYVALALSDAVFGERFSIGSLSGATPNLSFTETPEQWIVMGPDVHPGQIVLFDGDFLYAGFTDATGFHKNAWTTLPVAGAWLGTVEYLVLPHNEVVFRGSLAGGANVVGNPLLAALPAAIRPMQTQRFQCPQGTNNTTDGRVQIDAAGGVVIAAAAGTASYWFDQVRYMLY